MKAKILELLRRKGDYVSGQELCELNNVSRTAVWKAIKALEKEGYHIEAVRNRGYRLIEDISEPGAADAPDIFSKSEPKYWPGQLETKGWTDSKYNRNQTYDYNSLAVTTRHTMTFTPYFKNEDFYSTMLARWEMTMGNDNSQNVENRNTPNSVTSPTVDANIESMSTGNGQWRSMSMVYTGHFSYKGRYVIDLSLRADGTTKFGDDKKWGWFPGVSARWNISDEPFMNWS